MKNEPGIPKGELPEEIKGEIFRKAIGTINGLDYYSQEIETAMQGDKTDREYSSKLLEPMDEASVLMKEGWEDLTRHGHVLLEEPRLFANFRDTYATAYVILIRGITILHNNFKDLRFLPADFAKLKSILKGLRKTLDNANRASPDDEEKKDEIKQMIFDLEFAVSNMEGKMEAQSERESSKDKKEIEEE